MTRVMGRKQVLGTLMVLAALLVLALAGEPALGTHGGPHGTLDASCQVTSNNTFFEDKTNRMAQTFTAQNSGKLISAQALIYKFSGSGDFKLEIVEVDASGNPTFDVLASTTISEATVPSDQESTLTGNFSSPASIVAGQQYALALRTTGNNPANLGGNAGWRTKDADPCAGGKFVYQFLGGGGQTDFGGATDAIFSVYVAPANDDFASARMIKGRKVSVGGTTAGATREDPDEPDHNVDPADPFSTSWVGDHSVWYSWKAQGSGKTTIDTCTANIDSILAVYTGNSIGALKRVVDNNNDCPSGFGSKVSFRAREGKTYRIAVGDAGGARENTFTLSVLGKRSR